MLPWCFDADGTGNIAFIEGKLEGDFGYDYMEEICWEYPINSDVLKLMFKEFEGPDLYWKVIIKNNDEIELFRDGSMKDNSGNWNETITLVRDKSE